MIYQKELNVVKESIQSILPQIWKLYNSNNLKVTHKSKNDPVTEADLLIDKVLRQAIEQNFSEDLYISEESSSGFSGSTSQGRVWLVDPIDGTKGFIKKNGQFAISVGLLENGVPIFGIIYSMIHDNWLYGGRNCPMQLNGENIENRTMQNGSKLCLSNSEFKNKLYDKISQFLETYQVDYINSIAYKLSLIAMKESCGLITLCAKNNWDIAAGVAILSSNKDIVILDSDYKELSFSKHPYLLGGLTVLPKKDSDHFKESFPVFPN